MKPKELNEKLIKAFPEIKDAYVKETSWQDGDDTGSIVVLEDVFVPFIVYAIEKLKDDNLTKRIFRFIEDTLTCGDKYAKNAIEVGVIEDLASYDIRDLFEQEMLKETKESYLKSKQPFK